jgi:magnesium-protoporphyrin IX monomethyl ester (oxidative) cyclase
MALTQRLALQQGKQRGNAGAHRGWSSRQAARARASAAQEEAMVDPDTGLEKRKDGVKKEKEEDILTPRFYTTDFDEMERLFKCARSSTALSVCSFSAVPLKRPLPPPCPHSPELNPQLNQDELKACLEEFRQDYNQKHFVRNEEFKQAAEQCTGETRRIMVEFLERSCTAEFSGFLLYKELGRRLKNINPTVAEIFSLMSRDEARHSGFLNKAMGDFNLSLDLGFMTKNRQYTFFKPKFIFYAVWLSEKIGYWRYITIYRHLQQNPEYCYYPIFKFFENWCQDENRHGDFFGAVLKSQPQFLRGWEARQWSKFFCLSVYVTMYVNDHQRRTFYESLGLDPTEFDMHVLHQTNKTTAGLFPIVPDTYDPAFKRNLDGLCEVNYALIDMNEKGANFVQKVPQFLKAAKHLFALWTMPMIEQGSVDVSDSSVMPAAF